MKIIHAKKLILFFKNIKMILILNITFSKLIKILFKLE